MVKIIGIDPREHFVVLRLENRTIIRVRDYSLELDQIPHRPREVKHIGYEDLLLGNDFIVETHRILQKEDSKKNFAAMLKIIYDAEALIRNIYKPLGSCPPPPKQNKESVGGKLDEDAN